MKIKISKSYFTIDWEFLLRTESLCCIWEFLLWFAKYIRVRITVMLFSLTLYIIFYNNIVAIVINNNGKLFFYLVNYLTWIFNKLIWKIMQKIEKDIITQAKQWTTTCKIIFDGIGIRSIHFIFKKMNYVQTTNKTTVLKKI